MRSPVVEVSRLIERSLISRFSTSLAVAWAGVAVLVASASAGPLELQADSISYQQEGNVVEAEGNVRAEWKDNLLRASTLRFEQDKGFLAAQGGLFLNAGDYELRAESLELTIETETGVFRDVDLRLGADRGRFGGSKIEKRLGQRYIIRDGYYTTCDIPTDGSPDWEVSAEKIDVEVNDTGELRGGLLQVRGVPVLYIPYLYFPATTQRSTGLLFPRIGSSSKRGLMYAQPMFWAIDKAHDATFVLDVQTAARIGISGEYRYRPNRDTSGGIEVAYFNEKIRGDAETDIESPLFRDRSIPLDRARLAGWHRQAVAEDADVYVNVALASDDLYLREIDPPVTSSYDELANRTTRYTRSDVGIIKRTGFSSLGAEAAGFQDFVRVDDTGTLIPNGRDFTVHQPGKLWAAHDGQWMGAHYSVEGALTSFARSRSTAGQRLDILTGMERSLTPGLPVDTGVWAKARLTGYRMDDQNVVDPPTGTVVERLDEFLGRGLVDVGVDARTSLSRDYELSGDTWAGLRNTIEPYTEFRHTSNSKVGELPLYDGVDAIEGRSVATYGVESRFLGRRRDGGDSRELARLAVEQSYNLTESVRDDHFSDIDIASFLRPRDRLSLNGLVSYNAGDEKITGAIASMSLQGKDPSSAAGLGTGVGVSYYFVADGGPESMEARASFGLSDRIGASARIRYDFVSERFLEEVATVRIESACDCWAIDFGLINKVNPSEVQVRVMVELVGLGGLGSSSAQRAVGLREEVSSTDWRAGW